MSESLGILSTISTNLYQGLYSVIPGPTIVWKNNATNAQTVKSGSSSSSNAIVEHQESSYDDIELNCYGVNFNNTKRPIWNESTYQYLRDTYVNIVGIEESTITTTKSLENINNNDEEDKLWEVKYIEGKGRGLVAKRTINVGEPIWDASDHAIFYDEDDFKKFLHTIGYDLACDVMQWAYVEPCWDDDNSKIIDGCYAAALELGEASLMNSIIKGKEVRNVGWCTPIGKASLTTGELDGCDGSKDTEYAIRTIHKGEEIVSDYEAFDNDDKLLWYEELWSDAWEEDDDDDDDEDEEDEED